jgi:ATP-dependent RNA helicase RhlE
MTSFSDLGLAAPLLKAVAAANYTDPTPIQAQAIPPGLAGHDVLGIAQTGTGKTAAFALPILQRLMAAPRQTGARAGAPRVLVLAPTRELASQIAETFRALGRHLGTRVALIFGGVPKARQARTLAAGVDVIVATPGRLIDHMQDRAVRLDQVEVLVLDEADHMLDLGFILPIRRIVKDVPARRQTMFFSATMPKEIASLADAMLRDPVKVSVAPTATTVDKVEQYVIFVEQSRKRSVLSSVLAEHAGGRTLVFTRTKHGADRVVKHLGEDGVAAAAIHGNKSQPQRERALADFRSGATRVLVATDIAARGIDVVGVTHVINFELPNVPESYVHRIGRTARAGAAGIAISLCDGSERAFLRDIEKLIRARVAVMAPPGALARAA